jgi:hypothetical protein
MSKELTASKIKTEMEIADIILEKYLARNDEITRKCWHGAFKRIAEITGWCAECFYGDPDCFHCGGTGYNRDVLRQTF